MWNGLWISFWNMIVKFFVNMVSAIWWIVRLSTKLLWVRVPLKLPKGGLSGLRQFFTTESLLKLMKNVIWFTLKAYSMRNNFLEKSFTKCGGETIHRHFSKKSKLNISLEFVFIVCQVEGYRNILKLKCRPLAFTSHKVFFRKQKEIWN